MARFVRMSLLLAAAGLFVASAAFANIPDPVLSDVPDALTITPDASFTYTVIVRGALGPINGSLVEIRIHQAVDPLVCWCTGQTHPVIATFSGATGAANFNIAGGGCVEDGSVTADKIAQVFADGIELNRISINSPDAVNAFGDKVTDTNYVPDGTCTVGLADAVYHTGPIANGTADFCSNFTSPYDDVVAIGDAVIVTPYIVNGTSCVSQ